MNYSFFKKSEAIQTRLNSLSEEDKKKKIDQEKNGEISSTIDTLNEKKLTFKSEQDEVGYLIIPKINQVLPLFLGAEDAHLANGVAQIKGTSLPLEGLDSNTVIAGHRGYYGALIFRYLDQLEQGDLVYVNYLGEEAIYKVTGQLVIKPTNKEVLRPAKGKELVTLFTCHPYPQNSHRLLVKAERLKIEKQEKQVVISKITKSMDKKNSLLVVTKESIVPKGILLIGALILIYSIVCLFK
ncbi:class C sortase [Carnobacterium maltaromaticum]|uniref:class C sortase n=1 Tax=Carnobacterium maltaromaticum TaxID=2751 RepID=UPI001E3666E8|nr:class C sortase [Carnobacterium maltaromaticum]